MSPAGRLERLLLEYGFTRNEVRALLFLCLTFLLGLALRWLAFAPPAPLPATGAAEATPAAPPAATAPAAPAPAPATPTAARARRPVDINRAGRAELMTLPGIGARYADRIVALREQRGGFVRTEELLDVRGIGPRTLERIRPFITIGRSGAPQDSLTP